MAASNGVIRRDRVAAPGRAQGGVRAIPAGGPVPTTPPTVVVIESDLPTRLALNQLLTGWGLRVLEADPDSAMPVRDEHTDAAAIVADFELGATSDRLLPFTGLDIALLIARRSARQIPTLITSDNFGRLAIPACSPHRFPVMFKPVAAEYLRGWLVAVSLLADSPPWPKQGGLARTAA